MKNASSGRMLVLLGVLAVLAGLLAFSLSGPTTTVGLETDVIEEPADQPPAADADTGDEAAAPPASLPDAGSGGYLGSGGSGLTLLLVMLAGLGLALTGAGMVTVRQRRRVQDS